MRESALERYFTERLKAMGCLSFKFVSPNVRGVPDRILILPGGKVCFVELKTEKGRPTALQAWQTSRMRKIGADVRLLKGRAEVDEFLKEIRDAVHSA